MTHLATVTLVGTAPMAQCRIHSTEKLNKESPDAYEVRTWRNKAHVDDNDFLVLPKMALKNSIAEAAKFMGLQIPGKGKSTYTKHFESGLLVTEDALIQVNGQPLEKNNVARWDNFCPSDGVAGSGKRVLRSFPLVPFGWVAEAKYLVFDDTITAKVFQDTLVHTGQAIGIGSFRVRQRGVFGRFDVKKIVWEEYKGQAKQVELIIC